MELAPPPEKTLTQEEKDIQAFELWNRDHGYSTMAESVWLAARKSLREEIRAVWEENTGESMDQTAALLDLQKGFCQAAALRQLSRLLEGEEGK